MNRILNIVFFVALFTGSISISAQNSAESTRFYTYEAIDAKIEGGVDLRFAIDRYGKIIKETIKVVKGLGYGLDERAVEIVANGKGWEPMTKEQIEKNGGRHFVTMTVKFSLDVIKKDEWAEYYTKKGSLLLKEDKIDEALNSFRSSYKFNKKNPLVIQEIISILESKNELDEVPKLKKKLSRLKKS